MVREMSIDEIVFVYQGIMRSINQGTPIKTPLFETNKNIHTAVIHYENAKNEIAEKYLDKDDKGMFIPKDPSKEPVMVTDFKSKQEETMIKELEALSDRKISIEIHTVSPNRPVLITDKDGITKEITLSDYLELSGNIDAKVSAFLTKYFIHE